MTDPIVPNQNKLLAQLKVMVDLLERNTVTCPHTLKKIDSCLQMMPISEIPSSTSKTFDAMPPEILYSETGDGPKILE